MSRRSSRDRDSRPWPPWRRVLPTLTAAVIAVAYVIIAPRSQDLAAHLLRAKLFATEGFGLWNNWWYGGHDVLGYSVLFPPLAALLTPQLVAAISVPVSAALFESLVHRRFGEDAWLGALWFGSPPAPTSSPGVSRSLSASCSRQAWRLPFSANGRGSPPGSRS